MVVTENLFDEVASVRLQLQDDDDDDDEKNSVAMDAVSYVNSARPFKVKSDL